MTLDKMEETPRFFIHDEISRRKLKPLYYKSRLVFSPSDRKLKEWHVYISDKMGNDWCESIDATLFKGDQFEALHTSNEESLIPKCAIINKEDFE